MTNVATIDEELASALASIEEFDYDDNFLQMLDTENGTVNEDSGNLGLSKDRVDSNGDLTNGNEVENGQGTKEEGGTDGSNPWSNLPTLKRASTVCEGLGVAKENMKTLREMCNNEKESVPAHNKAKILPFTRVNPETSGQYIPSNGDGFSEFISRR